MGCGYGSPDVVSTLSSRERQLEWLSSKADRTRERRWDSCARNRFLTRQTAECQGFLRPQYTRVWSGDTASVHLE